MTLYMITAESESGENLDTVVRAHTPRQALQSWKAYYKGVLGQNEFSGTLIPIGKYTATKSPHATIWEIEGVSSQVPGVFPWVRDGIVTSHVGNMLAVNYVLR